MKKLAIFIACPLFALFSLVHAAGSMTAEEMIIEAEQAVSMAAEIGYEWRDTSGLISDAKKALADGKDAEAFDLAQMAYEQAVLAREQGEFMRENWQDYIPE